MEVKLKATSALSAATIHCHLHEHMAASLMEFLCMCKIYYIFTLSKNPTYVMIIMYLSCTYFALGTECSFSDSINCTCMQTMPIHCIHCLSCQYLSHDCTPSAI